MSAEPRDLWIVYDGDCPFCSNYVRLYRLREQFGRIHLINARNADPITREARSHGFDLNRGMVLKIGDQYYHGDKCFHMLALMGSNSSLFNRINRFVFSSPRISSALYPVMVFGRNLTLRILGRRLLPG